MSGQSPPPASPRGPEEDAWGPPVSADDLQLALSPQKGSTWWGVPRPSPDPCWGVPTLLPEEEASSSTTDRDVARAWMQWTDTLTTPTPEGFKNLLNNLSCTHARLQAKSKQSESSVGSQVSQLQTDLQHVARLLAGERLRSLELASALEALQSGKSPVAETRDRVRRAPSGVKGPPSAQGAPCRERILRKVQKPEKKKKRWCGAPAPRGLTPPPSQPETERSTVETKEETFQGRLPDTTAPTETPRTPAAAAAAAARGEAPSAYMVGVLRFAERYFEMRHRAAEAEKKWKEKERSLQRKSQSSYVRLSQARIEELSLAAKGSEKQQWSEAAFKESETLARRRATLYRERLQKTIKAAQEERLTLTARATALESRAKRAEEALLDFRLRQRESEREATRSLHFLVRRGFESRQLARTTENRNLQASGEVEAGFAKWKQQVEEVQHDFRMVASWLQAHRRALFEAPSGAPSSVPSLVLQEPPPTPTTTAAAAASAAAAAVGASRGPSRDSSVPVSLSEPGPCQISGAPQWALSVGPPKSSSGPPQPCVEGVVDQTEDELYPTFAASLPLVEEGPSAPGGPPACLGKSEGGSSQASPPPTPLQGALASYWGHQMHQEDVSSMVQQQSQGLPLQQHQLEAGPLQQQRCGTHLQRQVEGQQQHLLQQQLQQQQQGCFLSQQPKTYLRPQQQPVAFTQQQQACCVQQQQRQHKPFLQQQEAPFLQQPQGPPCGPMILRTGKLWGRESCCLLLHAAPQQQQQQQQEQQEQQQQQQQRRSHGQRSLVFFTPKSLTLTSGSLRGPDTPSPAFPPPAVSCCSCEQQKKAPLVLPAAAEATLCCRAGDPRYFGAFNVAGSPKCEAPCTPGEDSDLSSLTTGSKDPSPVSQPNPQQQQQQRQQHKRLDDRSGFPSEAPLTPHRFYQVPLGAPQEVTLPSSVKVGSPRGPHPAYTPSIAVPHAGDDDVGSCCADEAQLTKGAAGPDSPWRQGGGEGPPVSLREGTPTGA
ncbi:hypothetical protein Esti_002241 [Eimeria stiedai]